MDEIAVSVIIPVYNAEPYLRQCLDSVTAQTLKNIEIICVDDGSTDHSVEILNEYAARDPRFTLRFQENQYAGVARNTGKAIARGKYLVFWDADDYFDCRALQLMFERCEKDGADLCICSGRQFFESGRFEAPNPRYLRESEIPPAIPFNSRTAPEHVPSITVEAPWNKMYLRSFIETQGLMFHPSRNANDVFFVISALCLAERITLVNKQLVCYRKSKASGLVTSLSSGFPAAVNEWIQTARFLRSRNSFPERSFSNRAMESLLYLINNTADWDAYCEGYAMLTPEVLQTLGFRRDVPADYYYEDYYLLCAEHLSKDSPGQFLKWIGTLQYNQNILYKAKIRRIAGKTGFLFKLYQQYKKRSR